MRKELKAIGIVPGGWTFSDSAKEQLKKNDMKKWEEEIWRNCSHWLNPKKLFYIKQFIQKLLDKRKSEFRKKVENMNSTIHTPIGGISNIEWLRKEDVLKQLK